MLEADDALAAYLALPGNEDVDRSEVEASINEFLAGLRNERERRSGSRICPER